MTQMNGKSPVITGSATGTAPVGTKQGKDAPTAVLIGVTGGLGQALARLLAAEGFRLVLAARREHDPAALTGQNDGSAIYQSADVTDPASLEKLASAAFGHLGRIDAVVNLAGLSPRKAIEEYTSADVDDMLAVNVKGPISVTQAFLPGLRKQAGGGVVVHLGGCMDGRVALPFMSAYAATRGALASYVQGANRELAGTNVVLSFFGPVPSNTELEFPIFRHVEQDGSCPYRARRSRARNPRHHPPATSSQHHGGRDAQDADDRERRVAVHCRRDWSAEVWEAYPAVSSTLIGGVNIELTAWPVSP